MAWRNALAAGCAPQLSLKKKSQITERQRKIPDRAVIKFPGCEEILLKTCIAIIIFLVGNVFFVVDGRSQAAPLQQPASTATGQTKIDPAKEADIRQLLKLVGVRNIMAETMESTTRSIRPVLNNALPPGEYREKLVDLFFVKFQSKMDLNYLLDAAVMVYDKHFSHEEIKGLIKFYETPLGQKVISELPQVTNELREAGEKWGEKIGRDSMQEVLAEHPEMQAALESAGKAAQQK
jgi:hypothetical protein